MGGEALKAWGFFNFGRMNTIKEALKTRGDSVSLYALKRIEELEEQLKNCYIIRVGDSVTYQGVTYKRGDRVISPNGYEFFVVTVEGRWGIIDDGFTFCELQHCDLTDYTHC